MVSSADHAGGAGGSRNRIGTIGRIGYAGPSAMVVFPCHVCRTQLSADDAQAGQLVRCPTCLTTLRVPAPQSQVAQSTLAVGAFAGVGAGAGASSSAATGTIAPPRPYAPPAGAPRPSVGKRY